MPEKERALMLQLLTRPSSAQPGKRSSTLPRKPTVRTNRWGIMTFPPNFLTFSFRIPGGPPGETQEVRAGPQEHDDRPELEHQSSVLAPDSQIP